MLVLRLQVTPSFRKEMYFSILKLKQNSYLFHQESIDFE